MRMRCLSGWDQAKSRASRAVCPVSRVRYFRNVGDVVGLGSLVPVGTYECIAGQDPRICRDDSVV